MTDATVENAVAKEVLQKMETVEVSKQLLQTIIDKTVEQQVPKGWNLDAPMSMDEMLAASKIVAGTDFCPKDYRGKPESVMVAALYGRDLGLKFLQSLWCIAVINGRPSVWGDGALAVVLASGLVEDFKEFCGSDALAASSGYCEIKRRGHATPIKVKFTIDDAKLAGLWGKSGPWTNYPGRMLQMRARGFALRDGFADVLKGFPIVEETSDFQHGLFGPNTTAALRETERQQVRPPESKSGAGTQVEAPPTPTPPPPPKQVAQPGSEKPQPTMQGGITIPNPWRGKLKAVETLQYDVKEQKTGKPTGKKQNWYRLAADHDGKEIGFATYSDTEAGLARECREKGTLVDITWEHTGKANLRIKSMGPVLPEQKKEEKPAAPPVDDGPGFDREPGQEG